MKTYKYVLLIGGSGFGATWRKSFRELGLELAGVVEKDRAAHAHIARYFDIDDSKIFLPEDAAWRSLSFDLVVDCTPPAGRAQRLMDLAELGRDIITTKPVSWALEEIDAVRRTAEQQGIDVFVAMQKRYLPAFTALKEIIDGGLLGAVEFVDIRLEVDGTFWEPGMSWRKDLKYPSLEEGAIHHIDLLYWWLQPEVEVITAAAWNTGHSPFTHLPNFHSMFLCRNNLAVNYLSRWVIHPHTAPVTYFSGLRLEGTLGTASVENGRLSLNNRSYPLSATEGLDLDDLNLRMLKDIMLRPQAAALGLAEHEKCILLIKAIMEKLDRQ